MGCLLLLSCPGQLRACREKNYHESHGCSAGRQSGAAAADVLGQLCLLAFQKGTLHLESFLKQFEVN